LRNFVLSAELPGGSRAFSPHFSQSWQSYSFDSVTTVGWRTWWLFRITMRDRGVGERCIVAVFGCFRLDPDGRLPSPSSACARDAGLRWRCGTIRVNSASDAIGV
jgi:hypothetical protein